MGLLASALGMFFVVAAYLALRQARLDWFVGRTPMPAASAEETGPERSRLYFVTASACFYGLAGIGLVIHRRFAIWALAGGLMLQAIYYGLVWLQLSETERNDDERWRKALTAALISTAAFAFSAYAARQGILI
jgi:hypothetical protein